MEEDHLLKAFFERASEVGFHDISHEELAQILSIKDADLRTHFSRPVDFLKALARLIENNFSQQKEDISGFPLKDQLLENYIARIESLSPYQRGLKRLILDLKKGVYPLQNLLLLREMLPHFFEAMESILKDIGRPVTFPRKVALLMIAALVLYVWSQDQTPDLFETLQALDQALDLLLTSYEGF